MLTITNPLHSFGPPSSDRDGEVEPGSDQPELAFAKCLNGVCDKPREAEEDESDWVKEHVLPRSHRQQEADSNGLLADPNFIAPDVPAQISTLTIKVNDALPSLVEEAEVETSQLNATDDWIAQESKPLNPASDLWKVTSPPELSPNSEPRGPEIHDQQAFDSAPQLSGAASADSRSKSQSPDIDRVNTIPLITEPRTRSAELVAIEPDQRSLGDPIESLQNESRNNIIESRFDAAASMQVASIEVAPMEDSGTDSNPVSLPPDPIQITAARTRAQILESSATQSTLDGESAELEQQHAAAQAISGGLNRADAESQSFLGHGSQERKSRDSKLSADSASGKLEPGVSISGEISAASPAEIQESRSGDDLNSLNKLEQLMFELGQPMATRLGTQVIQQVVDQITSPSFELMQNELGTSQLKVQIYPEQLGQLEITVTTSDEGMVAQITASEMITSELLNREKTHLVEALSDKGMTFPDIDISHQDSRQRQPSEFQEERWNVGGREHGKTANRALPPAMNPSARTSSIIDMLV